METELFVKYVVEPSFNPRLYGGRIGGFCNGMKPVFSLFVEVLWEANK